ncbi:hypothetical protein fugu_008554 [Takifugu bimaculatus]|uniref:Uncharacterized protein n=1 Tax=Takifugu bimaculatus TaxID=433685 RepID=A0A4Z2B1Q2_9TELE|nr:hypothetical protein fugu_008554 [Takifugu bimaculatus]
MGRYTCVNNSTREHSSIYVYVKDGPNVFQRTIVNNILERAGENGVIPCLVTDPEVSRLTLETCDGRPLPSGMKYHGHLQRGVIISSVRKQYEGCLRVRGPAGRPRGGLQPVHAGRVAGARDASGDPAVGERHRDPEERGTVPDHLQLHQRQPQLQSPVGFPLHSETGRVLHVEHPVQFQGLPTLRLAVHPSRQSLRLGLLPVLRP